MEWKWNWKMKQRKAWEEDHATWNGEFAPTPFQSSQTLTS